MAFWDIFKKKKTEEPAAEEPQVAEETVEESPEEALEPAIEEPAAEEVVAEETAAQEVVPEPTAEEPEEEPAPEPEPEPEPEKPKLGFWQKLKKLYMGDVFGAAISEADEAFFDDLEEMLILADVGMTTSTDAVAELRQRMIDDKISGQEPVKACLREVLAEKLEVGDTSLNLSTRPSVVLVIGVNGVGKTTSIGKMAYTLRRQGKKVLLCAGDTFRAAAADQLEIWANRAKVDLVRQKEGADPGAVLFDALQAAKARNMDVVICDTAGRLHNKANLMAELQKLRRIIDRELPEAAVETLLVIDATTGQNGLIQAKQFQETAGCTGIILTKLDGTAKGGIVIAIAQELKVPVKLVGLGEGIHDLQPFDAKEYVNALI
jgi:fused signal recognition particle receptor